MPTWLFIILAFIVGAGIGYLLKIWIGGRPHDPVWCDVLGVWVRSIRDCPGGIDECGIEESPYRKLDAGSGLTINQTDDRLRQFAFMSTTGRAGNPGPNKAKLSHQNRVTVKVLPPGSPIAWTPSDFSVNEALGRFQCQPGVTYPFNGKLQITLTAKDKKGQLTNQFTSAEIPFTVT
jgi:hypothetical protein